MVSFLTALIGLVGVIVGAVITKRAERNKAVHEIKQRLYADYLEAIYQAKEKADAIYFSKSNSHLELQDEILMGECFTPTLGKEALVLVNLEGGSAVEFEKAVAKVRTCYATDASGYRHKVFGPALLEIRDIFAARPPPLLSFLQAAGQHEGLVPVTSRQKYGWPREQCSGVARSSTNPAARCRAAGRAGMAGPQSRTVMKPRPAAINEDQRSLLPNRRVGDTRSIPCRIGLGSGSP